MRCDENARIPFPTKQGNGPSSRDEEGKTGLFLSCGGSSVFLSSSDEYIGELPELYQGSQGSFQGSRGKVGFLSRRHSRKRPHHMLSEECADFSRVAAETWGSSRVTTGTSGTRSCGLRKPLCLALSVVSGVNWDIGVFWNGGMIPGVPPECPVETASS